MIHLASECAFWVGIAIQMVLNFSDRIGKGKLTRKMARRVLPGWYGMPAVYRVIIQLAPVWIAWVVLDEMGPDDIPRLVYSVVLIVLYGDDYLTGDDSDRWKRRFEALKNKVSWKWLPSMEPRLSPIPVGR